MLQRTVAGGDLADFRSRHSEAPASVKAGRIRHPPTGSAALRNALEQPGVAGVCSPATRNRSDVKWVGPSEAIPYYDRLRHGLLSICEDPQAQVLYFGPSVPDAECMAFLLHSRRIPAAFVSGTTRDVTRRKVIADFKSGAVKVLCNCEVLTTGFDAPRVTHVVMARPTVSQVLYEQMIGRGLRDARFGGIERCVIVDLEDNYRSDRPTLGYQAFRELWVRGRRSAPKTPASDPSESALFKP
jgi:hypothetical protein